MITASGPSEKAKGWRDERLQAQLLLDLFYAFEKFSEPVDPGNLSLCFLKRNRGRAEPGASRNALGNTALRRNHCSLSNFQVAYNANLLPNHNALAHPRAA